VTVSVKFFPLAVGGRFVRRGSSGVGRQGPDGNTLQLHRAIPAQGETTQTSLLYPQQV